MYIGHVSAHASSGGWECETGIPADEYVRGCGIIMQFSVSSNDSVG